MPFRTKPMFMFEKHHVAINVNNVLAIQRHTISRLVFLAYTLWKQPIQNRKVSMQGSEFPTIKPQIFRG